MAEEGQQISRHFWISRHGDVKSRGLYREIKAELNVEHVYPQSPDKKVWKELDDHSEIVDQIGNLTLVNSRTNSAMQNREFLSVKKPAFEKSRILLSTWISEQDEWGGDEIKRRQAELAEQAPAIWSFPEVSAS